MTFIFFTQSYASESVHEELLPVTSFSELDFIELELDEEGRYLLDLVEDPNHAAENIFTVENVGIEEAFYMLFDDKKPFLIPAEQVKNAIAIGGAAYVFQNDENIKYFSQDNQTPKLQKLSDWGEQFGSGTAAIIIAGSSYAVGKVLGNQKIQSTSFLAMKAFVYSGLATNIIKVAARRVRPNDTGDSSDWNRSLADSSFPSGHTTMAFAIGTFVAEQTKEHSKVIPIIAYSASTIAGLSRIYDDRHWASDVLFGAIIGHFVTKDVLKEDKDGAFTLTPTINAYGGPTMQLSYKPKEPKKLSKCSKDLNPVRACLREAFAKNPQ